MTSWTPHLDRSKPLYQALADAIEEGVAAGELPRGAKLPTHRELAELLGVTVGTVTRGYAAAERRGLVSGITGKGTFITPDAATESSLLEPVAPVGNQVIEMGLVLHSRGMGPDVSRQLATLAKKAGVQSLLDYAEPAGRPSHREVGAKWMERSGISASADNVVICTGGQHALTCALLSLVGVGEVVLTEPQTYPGLKTLARSLGVRLAAVEHVDEEGLLPEAFENVCRREGAKALYLMPSVNNPTTRCMGEKRRRDIARIAQRLGVYILEDDAYALLREARPDSFASFAPDRTVSVWSLSKALGGGLRTAFVYVPTAVRAGMIRAVQNTVWMAPPLLAELTCSWLSSGEADTVLAGRKADNEARWSLAAKFLEGYDYEGFRDGYFIWLHLPGKASGLAFEARAREAGVGVFAAERFSVAHAPAPRAVRVSLSGPDHLHELEQGLGILRSLLDQLGGESESALETPFL